MFILILLALIVLTCFVVYIVIRHRLKHKIETITAYTGGLGSGKTLLSVCMVRKLRRKLNFKYRFLAKLKYNFKRYVLFWKKLPKRTFNKICVFSNIPILLNKRLNEYSFKLTYKHLLLQEELPLHSIVFIDEVGAWASQFDFNQDNVIKVFDEFVRLYRHYTQGGYLIVNDQCSENINLTIRRRINIVHNLSNCLVFFKRFCFYFDRQINISEEIKTIDTSQGGQEADTQDNKALRFKFLPPKSFDTYCYKGRYKFVPISKVVRWEKMDTNRLIKCPRDKEQSFKPLTQYAALKCPNCGADLYANRVFKNITCDYCKTNFVNTSYDDSFI